MLVHISACGDCLCLERFETAAVQLADFVGDDSADVVFDIHDVDCRDLAFGGFYNKVAGIARRL